MDKRDTSFLLDYNIKTYNRIHEILATENSCAVVQPTGTGKSYIMMALLNDFRDKWKIVIAPSRDFLDNLENNKYWTSEKTLTLTYSYMGMNCDNIEESLLMHKIHPSQVGLIIIDEMHRAGAPKWGAGVKNLINICNNAKTVGLTATPKRYDEGRNMVTELFNDRLAQNMNLADAIQLGIIPQLSYVVGMHTLNINIDEVLKTIPDEPQYQYIRRQFDDYKLRWSFDNYFIETISKYIDISILSGKHIVFTSSIAEAERIKPLVKKWFTQMFSKSKVKVMCIHSKSNTKSKDIETFFAENKTNEVKVAIAVDMLNESFHCKDIKTISMFRGTQSLQVYMQQIGRALTAHGDAPYIFDFVDNFHSIKALEDMITSNNTVTDMQDTDSERPFVFKEFNDETKWFVKDIIRLKQLTLNNSDLAYKEILRRLNESDDDTVFGVNDSDFVAWASYMLKLGSKKRLIETLENIEAGSYNKLKFSIEICESLGCDWYYTFKQWKLEPTSVDEKSIRKMRSDFSKATLLNIMSDELVEYFKKHGIESRITYNKDKLTSLLVKHEPKLFKLKSKLLNFEDTLKSENHYEIYRDIVNLNHALIEDTERSWHSGMIGDAISYWLWNLYRSTYRKQITNIIDEYKDLKCIEEIISKCRKSSYSSTSISRETTIKADKLLGKYKTFNELPDAIKDIFVYNSIRSMDKVYDNMLLIIGLTTSEKEFKSKCNYQLTLDIMEDSLLEYVVNYRNKLNDAIKSDGYSWSARVMTKYNELVKIANGMEAYIKDEKTSDTEWFWGYAEQVKRDYIDSKTPQHLKSKVKTVASNNKLALALSAYSTYESIESEIKDKYKEDFKNNFIQAQKDWEDTYGESDNATLMIALIAISRGETSHDISPICSISAKLIKALLTYFDWVKKSNEYEYDDNDNYVESNTPIEIILVRKTARLMGNDMLYLFALGLSKLNREDYLNLYRVYTTTKQLVSAVCASIIMNSSDRDNQLMQDTDSSTLVERYASKLFAYNNAILDEYDKFMR